MSKSLRRTVRSFLQRERPQSPREASQLIADWFGRYKPDPTLLDEEIRLHFAVAPGKPGGWLMRARAALRA